MIKELLLRIAGMTLIMLTAEAVLPDKSFKRSAVKALGIVETIVLTEPIVKALFGEF